MRISSLGADIEAADRQKNARLKADLVSQLATATGDAQGTASLVDSGCAQFERLVNVGVLTATEAVKLLTSVVTACRHPDLVAAAAARLYYSHLVTALRDRAPVSTVHHPLARLLAAQPLALRAMVAAANECVRASADAGTVWADWVTVLQQVFGASLGTTARAEYVPCCGVGFSDAWRHKLARIAVWSADVSCFAAAVAPSHCLCRCARSLQDPVGGYRSRSRGHGIALPYVTERRVCDHDLHLDSGPRPQSRHDRCESCPPPPLHSHCQVLP